MFLTLLKSVDRPESVVQRAALNEPTPARPQLGLTCYSTFDGLESIRDEWNRLAQRLDADIFSSFEWCEAWWRHFAADRRLEVYGLRRGEELMAVVPLFREAIGPRLCQLRVIRTIGGDQAGTRCALLVDPKYADECAMLLLRALDDADEAWDCLYLGDLPGYFQNAETLARSFQSIARHLDVLLQDDVYPHAVFHLPESFDSYLASLSGNERNNIRKVERRIKNLCTPTATLVPPSDVPAALDELQRWHAEAWRTKGGLGYFVQWPGAARFHAAVAESQARAARLVLLRVQVAARVIGYVYAMRFGDRLHLFQNVRSPDASWDSLTPGRLLHCAAVRWAIAERITCLDAMSGFYEYKRRLGATFLGLQCITLIRRDTGVTVRLALLTFLTRWIDVVYFRVWYSKIAPTLRRLFPKFRWSVLKSGMSPSYLRSRFLLNFSRRSEKQRIRGLNR